MKHDQSIHPVETAPADGASAATSSADILPISTDYPGDAYLRDEIDRNRKKEGWLVLYGVISLALVAVLITIRLLFF